MANARTCTPPRRCSSSRRGGRRHGRSRLVPIAGERTSGHARLRPRTARRASDRAIAQLRLVRSFAPFGARVITGFREGVTLRLDGRSFTRVLALGGGRRSQPGGELRRGVLEPARGMARRGRAAGAPHDEPRALAASRRWPVSFRHALLALAPQPGAPVGALTSEALAVGDQGEVARYVPGKGGCPKACSGRVGACEPPRLRAVAWPTPSRAYAVGDRGAMWLWRAETGLWEPDPARR